MSDDPRITDVTGTITLRDGQTVEFRVGTDGGWQQWGNVQRVLARTGETTEAIAQALLELDVLPSDNDDDDEHRDELDDPEPRDIPDTDGIDLPSYGA